jgi:hypothetical protein
VQPGEAMQLLLPIEIEGNWWRWWLPSWKASQSSSGRRPGPMFAQ